MKSENALTTSQVRTTCHEGNTRILRTDRSLILDAYPWSIRVPASTPAGKREALSLISRLLGWLLTGSNEEEVRKR